MSFSSTLTLRVKGLIKNHLKINCKNYHGDHTMSGHINEVSPFCQRTSSLHLTSAAASRQRIVWLQVAETHTQNSINKEDLSAI